MHRILHLLCCLLITSTLVAQGLYNVKVGTFQDVKAADFTTLQPFGFVYGAPLANNQTEVYVGNFATEAAATALAARLKNMGYANAQPFVLPTDQGQPIVMIQLALQNNDRPIDWAALEKAGDLYVEAVDGTNKIMTGIYPDVPTAARLLPAIKELGYRDAFVKKVNNVRLIPVGVFETGIKKPLIPLTLGNTPPPATNNLPAPTGAPTTESATPTLASGVPVIGDPAMESSTTNTRSIGLSSDAPGLPAIDGKTKRSSSADLQRVLKLKGYYDGSIDGYYGSGTASAYEAAWQDMPELRKYRLLATANFAPRGSNNAPADWPEIAVLREVAEDIAAGMANSDRARLFAQQRSALYNNGKALTSVEAARARNWAATVWGNLDTWAAEDPLHAYITSALRIAYHQSQVRLEDHYMDLGLGYIEARDRSIAMLQNLVGPQLDRFL